MFWDEVSCGSAGNQPHAHTDPTGLATPGLPGSQHIPQLMLLSQKPPFKLGSIPGDSRWSVSCACVAAQAGLNPIPPSRGRSRVGHEVRLTCQCTEFPSFPSSELPENSSTEKNNPVDFYLLQFIHNKNKCIQILSLFCQYN